MDARGSVIRGLHTTLDIAPFNIPCCALLRVLCLLYYEAGSISVPFP